MTKKANRLNRAGTRKQMRMARGPTRKATASRHPKRTMKGGGLVSWFKTKLGMYESAFRSTFPRDKTKEYLGIEYCFRSELNDENKRNVLTSGNTTTAEEAKSWLHGDIRKFYDAGLLAYVCYMENNTGNYSIHASALGDKQLTVLHLNDIASNSSLTKVKIFVKFPPKPFNDFITEALNKNPAEDSPEYKCVDMKIYKDGILPKIKKHDNKPNLAEGEACPVIPGIGGLSKNKRRIINTSVQAVKFAYDRKMLSIVVGYGPHDTIQWQGIATLLFNILGVTLNIIDALSGRRLGIYDLICPRHEHTGIQQTPILETNDKLTVIAKNKYGFNAKYRGMVDGVKGTNSIEAKRVFDLPTIYIVDNPKTPSVAASSQCSTLIKSRLLGLSIGAETTISFNVNDRTEVHIYDKARIATIDPNTPIMEVIIPPTVEELKTPTSINFKLTKFDNTEKFKALFDIVMNNKDCKSVILKSGSPNFRIGILFTCKNMLFLASMLVNSHDDFEVKELQWLGIPELAHELDYLIYVTPLQG